MAPQLLNKARLEASSVFEAQKPEPRRNAEASKRRGLQSRLLQEGMAPQGLTEGDVRSLLRHVASERCRLNVFGWIVAAKSVESIC